MQNNSCHATLIRYCWEHWFMNIMRNERKRFNASHTWILQFDVAFVCEYLHFTQNVPSMFDISRASIKTNNSLSIWKILFTVPFQAQLFILVTRYLISYRYISAVCVILFANAFRYDCKSHFRNKFVLTIFKDFFFVIFHHG